MMHTRDFLPVLLPVLLLAAGCSGGDDTGFEPSEPRAFVSTLGTDTMNVEVYTRSGDVLEGTLVGRTPATFVIDYSATFGSDGTIDRLEAVRSSFDGNGTARVDARWSISLADTIATIFRDDSSESDTLLVAVRPDAIPSLGRASSSMFVFEQVAHQLREADAAHDNEPPVQLISPTAPRPRDNQAVLISRDSVSMDFFGSPRIGWLSPEGMILGASGAATTVKEETRRVPVDDVDLDGVARRWAEMDAAGTGIGNPSPPAMFTGTVDNAEIEIRYSQPAVRGRTIWGGLVPYDSVWRTGANAATHMTLGRPISFDGLELPADTYTLWSTFSEDGGMLIINAQTNQWGTQYDASMDVGRVPLRRSTLDEPVERFTISAEDTPEGGLIHLDWDRTRWSAAFTVGR